MADDDDDFVFLMRLALQRARLLNTFTAVHNGVEMIDYLQGCHELPHRAGNQIPSLVVLDAHLRLLTGYQVLEWIRKQPKFENLPVVILTGSELESQDMRAQKLGANEYHEKPFTMERLVELVLGFNERLIHEAAGRRAA